MSVAAGQLVVGRLLFPQIHKFLQPFDKSGTCTTWEVGFWKLMPAQNRLLRHKTGIPSRPCG